MLAELRRVLEALRGTLSGEDARSVGFLVRDIDAWKAGAQTPQTLGESLDRTLGHVWLSSDPLHRQVHELLARFQAEIDAIGGMTMNERLVTFDLMDRWDRSSDEERDLLYAKLNASRGGRRSAQP